MRVLRAFMLLFCVCCAAGGAQAADNKELARAAYRDGTRLYDLADYRAALEQFKKAYFNYEEPAFLFNIAQCYRQLDQKSDAIGFYKTYLRKVPDAPNADETRRMIATLETAQAASKHPPAPSAATRITPEPARVPEPAPAPSVVRPLPAAVLVTSAPPERKPAYRKWWVWTLVGVGVAAAATAVAVGVTEGGRTEPTFSPVRAQ